MYMLGLAAVRITLWVTVQMIKILLDKRAIRKLASWPQTASYLRKKCKKYLYAQTNQTAYNKIGTTNLTTYESHVNYEGCLIDTLVFAFSFDIFNY